MNLSIPSSLCLFKRVKISRRRKGEFQSEQAVKVTYRLWSIEIRFDRIKYLVNVRSFCYIEVCEFLSLLKLSRWLSYYYHYLNNSWKITGLKSSQWLLINCCLKSLDSQLSSFPYFWWKMRYFLFSTLRIFYWWENISMEPR